ncbi:YdeI family protein [Aquimarina sp. AU474]|uniref:YdeI/OmpD-associated family protein n=1 Tax=Aquimarina sp. AU474 TaxID=2108529 RepID=UPI000D69D773|nr:YdeI/OmpD-associated family protein [Aquimarina sp. AU474]
MRSLETLETVYFDNRNEWRKWLEENFELKTEVWLIYPKKSSAKPRIVYNDAVEEALCFGWIDSIIKTLDQEHTIQRFSIRKPKSSYSQANRERLSWLIHEGMIHHSIYQTVLDIVQQRFVFPHDILDNIKKDSMVWDKYKRLSAPYRRIRIAYIDAARKRPEEFQKRLKNFITKTSEGKIIKGFGGIDKYY